MGSANVISDCMKLMDKKDALLLAALRELRRLADDQLSHTEEELGDAARVDLSLVQEIETHLGLQEACRKAAVDWVDGKPKVVRHREGSTREWRGSPAGCQCDECYARSLKKYKDRDMANAESEVTE